jgi:hypothetical protein
MLQQCRHPDRPIGAAILAYVRPIETNEWSGSPDVATATILPLRRYHLQPPMEQFMTERDEDEFSDLSGEQEETVRQARKWVQGMVKEARKSDLHLQMVALEMMTNGLTILTGKDMETARAEVMAMFSEGDGNRLVLRRIRAQASSDAPD